MENGLPLKPLFDRVLLHREKPEKMGSIIIPEEAAKRHAPNLGKVIAVGLEADPGIHVGRTYVFGAYAGTWINEKGTPLPQSDGGSEDAEFYVCQDTDLIAEVIEQ